MNLEQPRQRDMSQWMSDVASKTETASELETAIFLAEDLPAQSWADALHSMIIRAFKHNSSEVFPPTWTRLNPDPKIGIRSLALELGPQGEMAIMFEDGQPVACGGFLPYRGGNWINAANRKSAEASPGEPPAGHPVQESLEPGIVDWEICCFCVSSERQGQGLSRKLLSTIEDAIKPRGALRLFSHYSVESNGDYWPRLGFGGIPGAINVLQKGFSHTAGMEGLRGELHFQLGVKSLE